MGLRSEVRKGVVDALRWVRDVLTEEIPSEPPVILAPARPAEPDVTPVAPAQAVVAAVTPPEQAPSVVATAEAPEVPTPSEEAPAAAEDAPSPGDPLLYEAIIETLQGIFDPEIPVDIYSLGLIYGVDITPDKDVYVRMTLTAPNCPEAQSLPERVQSRVEALDGVGHVDVDVVWDPPWTPEMMSEEARLELNM